MKIYEIFPTPIYMSKRNKKFNTEECKFIEKSKSKTYKNRGNNTSNDTYILDKKPLARLKKEIDILVKDYFNRVIKPSNDVKPYITQSWLNYTEIGQFHHKHSHPNSLVSGVVYINADIKKDSISFFKPEHPFIKLDFKEYDRLNSEAWVFPVETGDIFLFPSTLDHMVNTKQGTNMRTSLSFNVFIKGTTGSKANLTELVL